jgi:hypothetical protein
MGLKARRSAADATTESPPCPCQWWGALGDAQLNQLIDQALAGSPSLAASNARFEKAAALATASSTASDVRGTLSADATRQRYTANGMIPAAIAGYNSGNLQAGLSWSDFFGKHAPTCRPPWARRAPPGRQRGRRQPAGRTGGAQLYGPGPLLASAKWQRTLGSASPC